MEVPNFGSYNAQIGEMMITTVNDGMMTAEPEIVIGVDTAAVSETLQRHFRPAKPRLSINAFLIRHPNGLTLVDVGSDTKMGAFGGRLVANLDAFGVTPGDISTILLTHVHTDHAGGLTDSTGTALFPHAEIVLGATEFDFWMQEGETSERVARGRNFAHGVLDPYLGSIRTVADGAEGLPGVRLVELPGHTPGHSGWMIESGGESLLIWGDVVHLPGLQFERPEATLIYDLDPAQAEASRRRAFDMASIQRLLVAGPHLDFPAFGYVTRDASAFRFHAAQWMPEV